MHNFTNEKDVAIVLALLIAHHGLALFEHNQSLGLGKLVAGLEVEQQVAAQSTPSFETHCKMDLGLKWVLFKNVSLFKKKHQHKSTTRRPQKAYRLPNKFN